MADEILKIDSNNKSVAGAVTDDSNQYIKMLRIDDATKALKVTVIGGIPIVAGSDTWVQYNRGGALGADANFKFDYTNQVLMVGDGTPTYTVSTNNIFTVTKDVLGYLGVNIQNLNSGDSSADLFITNDLGTDTTNYLDMGISSSTSTDPLFTLFPTGQAYLFNQSESMSVGTAGVGKVLKLFTGGTLAANEGARLDGGTFSVGLNATTLGKVKLYGNTSGSVTLQPNAIAGSGITLTLPATSGTVALTSQLGSYLPLAGGTMVGNLIFTDNTYDIGASGATRPRTLYLGTSVVSPSVLASANDSGALGASGTAFSDLFLASGGVINWAAGNATLTHSTGLLTSNVPLALGANSLTLTGSIAATGNRVTKLWATDIESTNEPTVGGVQTKLLLAGGTMTGNITMGDATQIILTAPTPDVTCTGFSTSAFNSGYTSTAVGDLVYLDSSATWQKVDVDSTTTAYGMYGIALEVKASGNAVKVALPGSFVRVNAWNWTPGATLYASETPGGIATAIPTGANNVIRVIGFACNADYIYFMPSSDVQTTVA